MGEIADGDGRLLRHLFGSRDKISQQSAINNLKKLLKENHTPEDFSCSASSLMEPLK
jgi:hypothetical protein